MNDNKYPYLDEIIKALQDEIKAIEKKGESEIIVTDGKLARIESGEYVYSFVATEEVIASDDQPIEINYLKKRYKALLIGKKGNLVFVSTKDNLGNQIDKAVLIVSPIFLLKALISVIEQLPKLENYNFNFADEVIGNKTLPKVSSEKIIIDNSERLNEKQKEAVELSLGSKLAFIWGPPGTGKTTTIAKLVENLLTKGKRVLITSHTNVAVDTALYDVVNYSGNKKFYENGEILRYGIHQLRGLDKFELIFGVNIVSRRSKDLLVKLGLLDKEEQKVTYEIKDLESKLGAIRYVQSLIVNKSKLIEQNSKFQNSINELNVKIVDKDGIRKIIKGQLEKAKTNNWLMNLVQGLNVEKLLTRLNALEAEIETYEKEKKLIELKQKEIITELSEIENEIKGYHIPEEDFSSSDTANLYQEKLNRIDAIRYERRDIQQQIDDMSKTVLNSAKVVATTLTKCYIRTELLAQHFDTVIVDEISMAQLPQLLIAIGLSSQIIFVGDFLQLPPIVQADTDAAKKWLGTNLYDYFNITDSFMRTGKLSIPHIKPLCEQYRMHSSICELVNEPVYKGYLKSNSEIEKQRVKSAKLAPFSGHIALLDTSEIDAYCRRKEGGSRFTIKNAFIDIFLAYITVYDYIKNKENEDNKDIIPDERIDIFGIVSPYRAQANLITKILSDIKLKIREQNIPLSQYVEVNTVHRFQGNQRNVILFDTTDDYPMFKPALIVDDAEEAGNDVKLINVAVTRAKDKFILLGNQNFIEQKHSSTSMLKSLMHNIKKNGATLNKELLFNLKNNNNTIQLVEKNDLVNQIMNTEGSITIATSDLLDSQVFLFTNTFLMKLSQKGVQLQIFTQHPTFYHSSKQKEIEELVERLNQMNIKVFYKSKFRESFIFINNETNYCFIDEKNLVSMKIDSLKGFSEITRLLNFNKVDEIEICPKCKSEGRNGVLIQRQSRYGKFYGCSLYPKCDYIDRKKKQRQEAQKLEELKNKCPKCGMKLVKKRGRYGFFFGCSGYPDCNFILK